MALALADRIKETTTVTSTGPATLLGASVGYQSFSVVGNGNTCYYCIADQGGANWEVGIGTYTSAGTTLARTTVLKSSNAGALVSFPAGTKDVFVTYPSDTSVSGGGGGTYPTVQPTLNLDFANSKTVDPRITFLRNSTATYYDGQTTAMAEQNLLLQSNTFSNTAWVATNGTVASGVTDPAGTTTAFSFTATGVATLYQTLTTTATPYTLSFYIQRVTGTGAVNLTLDGTTLTPQTITGSWARYSVTATPTAASHTIGIQLAVSGNAVNIFSSQLENRSSMTAANITTTAAITNYIPVLMTAPAGVPRLDYNPTTGQALGLLIEEQRTNLLTYSSDFSNAIWTKDGTTIASDTVIAPDGTLIGDKLTESTSTGLHRVYQLNATATIGTTYTLSYYLKANQRTFAAIAWETNANQTIFNLTTGTVSSLAPSTTATINAVGNGWYRCIVTYVATLAGGFSNSFAYVSNGTTSYTGDGYSGIYIWGAQLEAGAYATSYIPTVASTVTRAADQASITGTNFSSWYNQAQGTVYAEYDFNAISVINANTGIFALNNYNVGGLLNRLDIRYSNPANTSNGVALNVPNVGTMLTGGNLNKIASSYSVASSIFASNYGTASSYSLTVMPNPMTQLVLGVTGSADSPLNGHIKKLSYYPVALSSSNLVALTS
jgi:hypothetical protein